MSVPNPREFSRDGKYFAFINSQGKFVVHEVETSNVSQVYTPNLHLNAPCTCFAWIVVGDGGGQSAKKKKKRTSTSSPTGETQTMVVFGTSKGGVALYSLASSKIEQTFKGAGHSGPIAAIYAEQEKDAVFTAGADGKVLEWSLSGCEQKLVHNMGVEKLTCMLVIDEGRKVLTGSKQLKLWDTSTGKVVKTLIGHTSNTVLVEKLIGPDGKTYALTGSINDRNVTLWSLEGDETSPVGLFAIDGGPEYISARLVASKVHLVAVSKSGVVHYYIKDLEKMNTTKPVKAKHTYEVALDTTESDSKTVESLPIFVASNKFSPNQEQLLIAYGTEHNLKFEHIIVEKELKQNVIIREAISNFQQKGQDGKNLKTKTPTVDSAAAEFLNPVNAGRKSLKTVEIPMEARLENLALTADSNAKAESSPKNMVHLLVQGLHSKDAAILRSVFGRNEPEVIQRTAERIPAQYISILLSEISSLMQKKTVHVATANCWLKALIHSHASQLMALGSENLLSNFGTCLGIIEYRVQHANSLSKLRGRLDLLVDQLDRTERLAKNPEELAKSSHCLIYQEEDDSDVDSVIGKELASNEGSSGDDFDGVMDEVDEEEDAMAGSFVRLRNGTANHEDESSDEEQNAQQIQPEESSDDDDDDEEMDVSD
ncbi:WD repeat-containing protein 43 [Topomyia yanbarensis]|uniref:WD repeat-containing protein 43 n=1 Tax=Topomyia yanbarensis TaxID=2498891 RepID=UPI00273A9B1B|nr:WD repeat-containing protein 43 [Topomyia yanbarensis]